MCDMDQYIDKDCEQCHPTCAGGCTDASECDVTTVCHPDCATCSGPGADECTSCYCNASLDNGCCTCDDDYVGHANYCKLAACKDTGCEVCVENDDEHSCVYCKDNFQYIHTFDESFGYCEYCYDDDFYPYATCGGRQADGIAINLSDDVFTPGCVCSLDEHLVDGHCTTCGQHCTNCDNVKCLECEFGYHLDNTETVCIDFCPSGTVYDSLNNSGRCITEEGQYAIVDLLFQCASPVQN